MRKFVHTLLFLLCISVVSAQSFKVSGSVLDEAGAGVPFASLALYSSADSVLVKTAISSENGGFSINGLDKGSYYLAATFVGYTTFNTEVFELTAGDRDLGKITLKSGNVQLDAVDIVAQKAVVEVMADKTVFNVENVGSTAGLSGFDILRKSPGVIIDNNDNVIVEGKSGVQFWIDGKPSILAGDDLTNYLRSLQASDIESIEVITQPSSKYDAEGTAGIINIVLKRNKNYGTNGSLSAGGAYGRYWKHNNSLSLNNRTRKTNLYMNYSGQLNKTFNTLNFRREVLGMAFDQRSIEVPDNDSYNLKAGMDYFLSPKSTLGLIVNGNVSDGVSTNTSRMEISNTGTGALEAVLRASSTDDFDNQNIYLNANYRFQDTLGHKFSMDVDWGNYTSDRVNLQPNDYFNSTEDSLLFRTNYQMITPLDIEIKSIKGDYEQDFLGGALAIGVKVVEIQTDNSFDFFSEQDGLLQYEPENSNSFDYSEMVTAGYFNYAAGNQKFSYQFGLRAEQTNSLGVLTSVQMTEDDRVERDYLNLFPSGGFTYNYHPKNTFAVNYSRRINRPEYQNLNPFEYRLNELGFRKGNPFLQPSYTHNVKVTNTHNYTLSTSLSYSYVQDFTAQVVDTLDAQVSFLQTRNVADEQVFSANVSYPFQVEKWWSVFLNASYNYTRYIALDDKFQPLQRGTFNIFGQNTFNLPKNYRFELSGWYNSPSIWGGTFKTGAVGSLDLALSKKFFDDRLTASVSGSDIFLFSPWTGEGNFGAVDLNADGRWESRQVRFNFLYTFGNQNVKVKKRKSGTEDEINRI
ncbi:MAG: outer membrane beta-barrel protein [Bacteroidota bacterium]